MWPTGRDAKYTDWPSRNLCSSFNAVLLGHERDEPAPLQSSYPTDRHQYTAKPLAVAKFPYFCRGIISSEVMELFFFVFMHLWKKFRVKVRLYGDHGGHATPGCGKRCHWPPPCCILFLWQFGAACRDWPVGCSPQHMWFSCLRGWANKTLEC